MRAHSKSTTRGLSAGGLISSITIPPTKYCRSIGVYIYKSYPRGVTGRWISGKGRTAFFIRRGSLIKIVGLEYVTRCPTSCSLLPKRRRGRPTNSSRPHPAPCMSHRVSDATRCGDNPPYIHAINHVMSRLIPAHSDSSLSGFSYLRRALYL